jgi:glycosyltransferase involved in cell wall biosynthesis
MTIGAARVWKRALSLKPDVFHIHDPELLPGGLVASARGLSVVYDVHEEVRLDILAKDYMSPTVRRFAGAAYAAMELLACTRFAYIIAANDTTRHRLAAVSQRLAYVPNYPMRDELAIRRETSGPREGVAYIGVITRDRGAIEMIQAAARAEVILHLAGRFESPELMYECKSMPEWKNVKYVGQATRPMVAEILNQVQAGFVLLHPDPNNMACLSTKLLEYMSAGVPVIASDFPGYRKIIDATGAGICVPPLDVDKVAMAVQHLRANPALRQLMGERGQKAIQADFNWEKCSEELMKAYQKIEQAALR